MPTGLDSSRPLLIVVATVHLDSQWRWTIQDTIRQFIPRTLKENFELFDSHPRYELSFEGAFRYMLMQEYYPERFEELKRWVAAGRWHPVGGMLDAPDVNCVSPESLIRHVLYGNGFFERELGRPSQDVFLPDCFGFGRALPSVAAHCGLLSFSSSKLIKWKAPDTLPFEMARWRGPDGGEVVAAIQPGGYGEGIEEDLSRSKEWAERLGEDRPVRLGIRYVGTGDKGGSPDRASLDRLEAMLDGDGPVRIGTAAADALTAALTPEEHARLPVWDDELLLPTHGTGCWTAQAGLKRWNRRNELLGDAAERAALVADWLGAIDYPRERLTAAWIRFLWHQMHDDLTGTSIPAAYDFTWNDEAVAANLFAGVLADSVDAVARGLDTATDGTPLVVFNPSGHRREDIVEVTLEPGEAPDGTPDGAIGVRDPEGRLVRSQVETLADGRRRLLFLATVEPVSMTVFEIVADAETVTDGDGPEAAQNRLENHRYRIEIDANGDIASLFDKRLERELLARPIRFELLHDPSRRWPAWEIRPRAVLRRDHVRCVDGPATVRVMASGPVRATVEIARDAHGSSYRHRVHLAAGAAGDRVEVESVVDWATRGRLLKAAFAFTAASEEATYDLGVGTIRRGNNRPERYEVPAQQWASLTDDEAGFGVAVLNDCKYGWDKPADNELRLSLIHSPSSLRKYPHQRTQDHGTHRFTFALTGHAGPADQALLCRQAEELNRPLTAFVAPRSPGTLGRRLSALRTNEDVAVRALKKAEAGDAWIVRLQEIAGRAAPGSEITLPTPVLEARQTNGREQEPRPVAFEGTSVRTDLGPAGIATLAVSPQPPASPLARPGQTPLDLPWNCRADSRHDEAEPTDFDGRGRSLPGELLPPRLVMGGLEFALGRGESGDVHAVRCEGQRIELPSGHRRLWLLATSATGDIDTSLWIDDGEQRLRVPSWTGWIAERPRPKRWLGLAAARPGRSSRDEVAWIGTHRHRQAAAGGIEDEPYVFCYIYRYAVDLPPGASTLRLPAGGGLRLFAATLTDDGAARCRPTRPLYG